MTALTKLALGVGTLLIFVGFVSKMEPKHSKAQVPESCPIRAIKTGMTINEAQRVLPSYKFDYRGEHQDQTVYHIDAGQCAAFLDFDFKDHGLDVIQYDDGPILYREKKAEDNALSSPDHNSAPTQPTSTWKPVDPRLPNFEAGQIVNGIDFVSQFVQINRGVNGFDDRQLEYLGNEAWESYLAMAKADQSLFSTGGVDEEMKFYRDWNRIARLVHGRTTGDGSQE